MNKVSHTSRQPRSTVRAEEIELATVYLELNIRVQPTWGHSVEPDAYITDIDGGIIVPITDLTTNSGSEQCPLTLCI